MYSLQQIRIWRYLIQLKGMHLHHSFIHLTRRVLFPNVFAMCSASSSNRMAVLISVNFFRMEYQIPSSYSYFTGRMAYYLKTIHSMTLGIKYWTISDAGCMTKSDSSTTAVRVSTTSTSTIQDQIFGRCIE